MRGWVAFLRRLPFVEPSRDVASHGSEAGRAVRDEPFVATPHLLLVGLVLLFAIGIGREAVPATAVIAAAVEVWMAMRAAEVRVAKLCLAFSGIHFFVAASVAGGLA